MREKCPSRKFGAIAPYRWVIPSPGPSVIKLLQNPKQNSLPFLREAGIEEGSKEHRELKTTIRALHHQYLNPFKCLEDQAPDHVDQLMAKARISLAWLVKYEDDWPARIYLKRYMDARRPHLACTKYDHSKQSKVQKLKGSYNPTRNLGNPNDIMGDDNFNVKEFLGSLTPSLEHHLDAFVELGIKNQETLQAFLSWPQAIQAQFLDEGHGVLQLTSLERKGLLVGCNLLVQGVFQKSLGKILRSEDLK